MLSPCIYDGGGYVLTGEIFVKVCLYLKYALYITRLVSKPVINKEVEISENRKKLLLKFIYREKFRLGSIF